MTRFGCALVRNSGEFTKTFRVPNRKAKILLRHLLLLVLFVGIMAFMLVNFFGHKQASNFSGKIVNSTIIDDARIDDIFLVALRYVDENNLILVVEREVHFVDSDGTKTKYSLYSDYPFDRYQRCPVSGISIVTSFQGRSNTVKEVPSSLLNDFQGKLGNAMACRSLWEFLNTPIGIDKVKSRSDVDALIETLTTRTWEETRIRFQVPRRVKKVIQ